MDFDWKKLVGGLAPTIGTALGGPLAGMAIKAIAGQLLGNPDASETEVSAALSQGLSGEQIVALKAADQTFAARMKELDIDVLKVNQAGELAYVTDTNDARQAFSKDDKVFWMGTAILGIFFVLMGTVLAGCFALMTGFFRVDPAVAGLTCGLIGTIVGYVAANAQQVVSYFFGSSKGSKDNGERIGAALTQSLKAASEVK